MTYLLDTNTISELIKPDAAAQVAAWVDHLDEHQLFLSVATFAEIRRGIELIGPGRRRERLLTWLEEGLPQRFEGRVLPIDPRVAEAWGVVIVRAQRLGRPISVMDGFFAATAEAHGLTLATRSLRHFEHLGVPLFDPWTYLP
jgi:predicted nucleic acid-binding protein